MRYGLALLSCTLVLTAMAFSAALCSAQEADEEGWIALFNGNDMTGWKLRDEGGANAWQVEDGVLFQDQGSTDIYTEQTMGDHELHVEFLVPPGSNSGVYIQGRYEIQICDSAAGGDLNAGMCGAIYSKLVPSENAAKPANEWQTFDVTFRQSRLDEDGNVVEHARITLVHNGITVIDDKEIDGITGGSMDNQEGTPGPLMLQGNHGPIKYRNIKYRPLETE